MEVRLLRVTADGESLVSDAVRTSSEIAAMSIETIVDNDYSSVLEHICFTFSIKGISVACSRELLEHRIASHTARSTRYCDETDFKFYEPSLSADALRIYREAIESARKAYVSLIELGVSREEARYVLPLATHTHYIWTVNARSLINFLSLRLCIRASPEMRELALQIYKICCEKYPRIFKRIYCRGVTLGVCPENNARPKECPFREIIKTKSEMMKSGILENLKSSQNEGSEQNEGEEG